MEMAGLDTLEVVEYQEEAFSSPVQVTVFRQNIAHAVRFLFQLLI